MGTHRRGSNSESGMRLLRRLEKNHDGIRSAATRQHYIQIYQAMKYLSLDVADFIEKGPQLAELPGVEKVGHTRPSARGGDVPHHRVPSSRIRPAITSAY